ncbi:MAG: hypothetical protein WCF04_13865 [Candidatus Nanopelagicales bacterium]
MSQDLIGALEVVQAQLGTLRLPLATKEAQGARDAIDHATGQLEDYVLPRLRSVDAPLLTVVAGSTGSGKSTLVNSLVGRPITRPGVLRPTTRHPVLAHNPAEERWFIDDRILPRLPRITGGVGGPGPAGAEDVFGLRLVPEPNVPMGLALLDAPDIDSVSGANRHLAAMLMAAADLWIFVTTAARYADAVPWNALRSAVARDASIALLLNRVPMEAIGQVTDHLRRMLAEEGLAGAPLFVIPESPLREGMIERDLCAPISGWLSALAGDSTARAAVARRTLEGAIGALVTDLLPVADAADRQVAAAHRLRELAVPPFVVAAGRVADISADGSLLRGEVLARWQEFVGAGETFKKLETGMARLRDRITAAFRGEPVPPEQATEVLETGLARVIYDELATACEQADSAWREDPAGTALLGSDDLATPPEAARDLAAKVVREWQSDVLTLIRSEGADKRATARALAYGVNGTALALMVLVFSTTGGLTGAEVGIAGGSAVLAQKLLEAVFSEDAVRRMSTTARERLIERVNDYFALFQAPFTRRLDALDLDPHAGAALRVSVSVVLGIRPERPAIEQLPAAPPGAIPKPTFRGRMRVWLRGAP